MTDHAEAGQFAEVVVTYAYRDGIRRQVMFSADEFVTRHDGGDPETVSIVFPKVYDLDRRP